MRPLTAHITLVFLIMPCSLLAQAGAVEDEFVVPPRYRKVEDLRPEHFKPAEVGAGVLRLEEEMARGLGLDPLWRRRLLSMRDHLIQERKMTVEQATTLVTPFYDAALEKWKRETKLGLKALVKFDSDLLERVKVSERRLPGLQREAALLEQRIRAVRSSLESAMSATTPSPAAIESLRRQEKSLNYRLEAVEAGISEHKGAASRLKFYARIARERITELLDDRREGSDEPDAGDSRAKIAERIGEAARHRANSEPKRLLSSVEGLLALQPDYPPYLLLLIHLRASQGRLFDESKAKRLIRYLLKVRVLSRDREEYDNELRLVVRKLTNGEHELSLEEMKQHARQIQRALEEERKLFFILDRWWAERQLKRIPKEIAKDARILARLQQQLRRPHLGDYNRRVILRDMKKVSARIEEQRVELDQIRAQLGDQR